MSLKETTPKVTVLLAAYNGEKYVEEQLDSILAQENVSLSIIVSVDKSDDLTLNIVETYVDRYPDIVSLLPYGAQYGSAGQNFFNLLCNCNFDSCDYVAFADQDDIWFEKKISRAIECIAGNSVDGYSGNVIAWWDDGRRKLIHKSDSQVEFDYLFESAGPGCTFVMKKALAIEMQKFLNSLATKRKELWLHDWFCYSFARSRGYKWHIDHEPMMHYRQHDQNVVGANSGMQAFMGRVKEVVSGNAFDKVLVQANMLNLNSQKPVTYIQKNNFLSLLKVCFMANKCRRKFKDKVLFFCALSARALNTLRK